MQRMIMRWLEKYLGEHVTFYLFGCRVTIYGFNAMHVAVNIKTRRWGYICYHPPMICFSHLWPWYFYVSPNGTPSMATYAIGPGVSSREKRNAKIRHLVLGHNFHVGDHEYSDILNIEHMVDGWPGIDNLIT